MNDSIIIEKNTREINKKINALKETWYNVEDSSNTTDYLGVNFKCLDENTLELIQPQLIQ